MRCVPVCCCVRVGRNVSAFDVQPVTRLLCCAFMCQVYALPVTMAVSLGLLVYASYKSLNTAQIRLIMEDHSPSWVKELQERGLLKPFSEVVVRREPRAPSMGCMCFWAREGEGSCGLQCRQVF